MTKPSSRVGAMVIVAFMATMIGGVMTGSENASGASKVDLYANDITTSSVRLTWTESEDWLFDQYEIYMDDGTGWRLLKTLQSQDTLEYEVTSLDSGTEYRFKVRDVDSLGYQDSDTLVVTTEEGGLSLLWSWLPYIIVLLMLVFVVGAIIAVVKKKQ